MTLFTRKNFFLLSFLTFLISYSGETKAQCNASFTYSTDNLLLNPYNNSSGSGSFQIEWDFGDGNTSNQWAPLHYYWGSGTYNVWLKIEDSLGCKDSTMKTVTVTDTIPCSANFSYSITDLKVSFGNTSTNSNPKYVWDFGDGNTSTAKKPTHTYSSSGSYTVCLYLSKDTVPCDTMCQQISVKACNAMFTSSSTNLQVSFTNLSSSTATGYNWSFGDGNTSTQKNPTHTFSTAGTYGVYLIIANSSNNCTDTFYDSIDVYDGTQCNAEFSLVQTYKHFRTTNTSTGYQLAYKWDFGDGYTSTAKNPQHNYQNTGTYDICLIVSDVTTNCEDTFCQTVTAIDPVICDANFTHSENGLNVTFTSTTTENGVNYSWDFGDSQSSNQKSPSHTYSSAGTYYACLIVTDSINYCRDTICDSIVVTNPACLAKFNIYADTSTQYLIYVQDQSIGSNLSYNWNFGDGNSSTSQTPTHTYSTFGTFILCLTVNDTGCTSTFCDTFSLDSSGNFSTKRGFTMVVLPNGPVSVNQPVQELNINVYPNPFSNALRIEWGNALAGHVEIFDAAGRSQFKQSNVQAGSEIELSSLGKGVYIMQVQIGNTVQQHRLIKQ